MKASWNGAVIAESSQTVIIEGNHYFPSDSVNPDVIKPSSTQSVCPWKGTASYYSLDVNGQQNTDAAWSYLEPKDAAKEIKGYMAFWKGVQVSE
jgi:uncharacterized protein (DUF427 family)